MQNTIEEVRGTNVADFMNGDANAQSFRGYGGNDTLNGKGGNDFLDGGDGTDVLIARDNESDSWIGCDAGTTDVAILDSITVDPPRRTASTWIDRDLVAGAR